MALRILKFVLFTWLIFVAAAQSEAASAATQSPSAKHENGKQAESAKSPALWKIVNGKSTVYFLGSVHVLPAGFAWKTPAIDQVIQSADVFAFETNLDFGTAEFDYFMDNHGYLPRGQTLHQLLSPPAREKYLALVQTMHVDPNRVDYLQPGVAALFLDRTLVAARASQPLVPGVDDQMSRYAKAHGKQLLYLESLQSQLDVLMKLGGGAGVAVLEKRLLSDDKGGNEYQAMLAAWAVGDLPKLMSMDDMDPKERVLMLDNRNRAWISKIEAMLNTPASYLVTVGAAHLAGPNSVISLLCAKHWKVERIQTGATPPPRACGT
jgi:hypothetical protein